MPTTVWKAPFKVNTTDDPGPFANAAATNEQSGSAVVALTSGRMLFAWNDSSTNFSGLEPPDSVGQVLDPLGALVGGETYLSGVFGDGAQTKVDIAALPNGGFVAAYQTQDFTFFLGTGENVTFQVFDNAGAVVFSRSNGTLPGDPEGVFQLGEQRDPDVVAFADGSFMIAYEDDSAGGSDIRGVVIDSTGAEQPSFLIADVADDAVAPVVDQLNNGNLITVFQQNGAVRDIQFSIVTAAGAAVASGTAASAANDLGGPDVAVLTGGTYVVVWTDDDGDGAPFDSGIKAQLFQQDGTAIGGVIAVNAPLAGIQDGASVVALDDGGFFVAWSDGPSGDIVGQQFDSAGAKVGAEVAVGGPGTASEADLSLAGDGRILLSFTNTSAGDDDVYAAILDPRASPVNGTANDDVLTSLVAGGTVNGLNGADTIFSSVANDTLNGGFGIDTLDYGLAGGPVSVNLAVAAAQSTGGAGSDTVSQFENLNGGGFGDLLTGNAGGNTIDGRAGADRLYGAAGNDTLNGGDGNDLLNGGDNDDTLNGGASNDTMRGEAGGDTMNGGAGADTARAGTGDDIINGDGDNDAYLSGESGSDTVNGGAGNDRIDGGSESDTVNGGADSDFITGGTGGDTIDGGDGDDGNGIGILRGEDGDDTISGGAGIDRLEGGNGNDRLIGGLGDDRMTGGANSDFFVFTVPGEGNDLIRDWVAADDQLEIDASAFGGGLAAGALAANRLVVGAGATADQAFGQFLYDTTLGQLAWDDDGTGGNAAVNLCILLNGAAIIGTLAVGDFDIVA